MTEEKPEFIHPDDPKPVGKDQIKERKAAKREGRVIAPPRDEIEIATETAEVVEPVAEVETGEPTPPEGDATEGEPPAPPEGDAPAQARLDASE